MKYTTDETKKRRLLPGYLVAFMLLLLLSALFDYFNQMQAQPQPVEPTTTISPLDAAEMVNTEEEKSSRSMGVQIRIDDKPLGIVKDMQTAESLLEQYKQHKLNAMHLYDNKDNNAPTAGKAKVTILSAFIQDMDKMSSPLPVLQSVQFVQKIELKAIDLGSESFSDSELLLRQIETGAAQPLKYTVKPGDCISCIASKYQIPKQVIYDNNPRITNSLIRVGDELDLTVLQPLLTLKTIEQRTAKVTIPFDTAYIDDASMKLGAKEAVSSGENGLKQMEWKITRLDGAIIEEETINEITLHSATQALVKRGTKVIPGVGNGSFAWPVYRAKLTSEYGNRGNEFHPGADMVSEQSTIMAADNGIIQFAGYKSGYGECIIIDHQNGYSTLYGHLSKIIIQEHELVQKGDKIGIMGSTGNATGVHLHFEIRSGTQQENPMKYLSRAE